MTRRGSLVYYLSAWILGCFFMSAAVWAKDQWGVVKISRGMPEISGLLFFTFYGLILGAIPALIAGFLLRRVASLLKCKTPAHWAIFGAILLPLLIGISDALLHLAPARGQTSEWILSWLTSGPHIVVRTGWWLAIPAGAVTGYFLGRIQRAFAPGGATQAQPPQATA
jgi:hypothetical protein